MDNRHDRNIATFTATANLLLAILATIFGCSMISLSLVATFVLNGSDDMVRAQATMSNHTYYVESVWKPGAGDTHLASFFLNECDASGMNCKDVHEQEYRKLPLDDYKTTSVVLIPDSDTNTIGLRINDETVYVHHIE